MSAFVWLDYSEQERRQVLDILGAFRQQGTVDELGIGAIRDAFANRMFPGTSTTQTRARYFLFVPWIYQRLERKRVPSGRVEREAHRDEIGLISPLMAAGNRDGIIGIDSQKNLKRLPSNIYWLGLAAWGIRRFSGSQPQYHRSLDGFYRLLNATRVRRTGEDDLAVTAEVLPVNWDPALPAPPPTFPSEVSLTLTAVEARYLQAGIRENQADSLLAYLVENAEKAVEVGFPWEHPAADGAPTALSEFLHHARCFSEGMHGGTLLYNLLLARALHSDDWAADYEAALGRWASLVEERFGALSAWDRQRRFWDLIPEVSGEGPRARFVGRWLDIAIQPGTAGTVAGNARAVQLIRDREWEVKRNRGRLHNPNALKLWGGSSLSGQLSYRWPVAQRILNDIVEGLRADA